MQEVKSTDIDISIVVVNYNVKEYLANLLHSIERARHGLNLEIFVVDNNSTDGSIPFLKERFPNPIYIVNKENVGFGRANNQAIRQAKGKYTLLINPDVLISENTLTTLFDYMNKNPECGACGCKILNPDGTFAPESKRSTPTPLTALYKVLGLTTFFPKNKKFGSYYMGWLDEDKPAEIEVLSGSLMFYKTSLLKELDGFDERFFMYGEDIDLCYRTRLKEYKIMYLPQTSIIHYKGESTKKDNLRYITTFNKALYQFFDKHYNYGYTFFFRVIIITGIFLKSAVSYFLTLFQKTLRPLVDVLTINIIIVIMFLIRFQIPISELPVNYNIPFFMVNFLLTAFFLLYGKYYALYSKNLNSISALLKTLFFTFIAVVSITFFLRDFAFSRLVLLAGAVSLSLVLPLYRFTYISLKGKKAEAKDRLASLKILVVGYGETTADVIRKIRSEVEWNYEIKGILTASSETSQEDVERVPVLGHVSQISEIVQNQGVDQIIFLLNSISHDEVLKTLTTLRDQDVVCKVVPGSMDYIIGKSNVEYFDDIPVVDLELPTQTAWNKFLKRNLDFFGSLFLIILLSIPVFFKKIFTGKKKKRTIPVYVDSSTTIKHEVSYPLEKCKIENFYSFLFHILIGEFSLVGSPIIPSRQGRFVFYKPGLTGLRQINEQKLFREEEKQRYEMHYLQTYTIWKDLEILLKSLLFGFPLYTTYLEESSEGDS